ncbi:putative FEN2 - Pantothenate permease [Ustilago hordei]|uniref:Probable FEN2-Pantothenate permease n=1 Tax=Ustilago hordei TaxID=120017 RepID=I2FWC3_USTHO|nr:putative FEN2 - Pantothenate permease [Ustilago hordei]CCF51216.1 probable FEN2-Pantothenate permease [Ustilago hordei]SYW82158.1 probable FEN2 - Pantothenate permease [Ustilago hordei]
MGFLHKARVFLWGQKPATKLEQRLLLKIDCVVMTFCTLLFLSNYLNRANFSNAYLTGMKEDLNFKGKQFNQVNSIFTAGYIIGLWPNNLILQVVPPRWWLPFCGAMWGILSACLAATKTPEQVMAIRFLQALFESSTFTGCHWILGSWYKEEELGKRSGIFSTFAQMGSLWSGVMQGRISQTMNGRLGLKSYQWLFIIDFALAMPIAIFGILSFPDTPRKTKAWFLSEEERQLAVARLPQHKPTKMSWDLLKRVFGRWHIYLFSLLFGFGSMLESAGINSVMGFWFKSLNFSKDKINYYPLSLISIAIFTTILAAYMSDYVGSRWWVNPVMGVIVCVSSIMLLVWDIPYSAKFFAFAIQGAGYMGQATNFAWANIVCAEDEQERAMVLAGMNVLSNIVNSWWNFVFWPATSAPRYTNGWISMFPLSVFATAVALAIVYLERKDRRKKLSWTGPGDEEGRSDGEVVNKLTEKRVTEEDDASSNEEKGTKA